MFSRSIFVSKKASRLTDSEFVCFFGLVMEADDEGRGEGEPFALRLKFANRGWADKKLETMLDHLDEVALIWWYANRAEMFYEVVNFMDHQQGSWHGRSAKPSRIPAHDDPESTPVHQGRCTGQPLLVTPSTKCASKGSEVKGSEVKVTPAARFAYPVEFEKFWKAYPRPADKRKAYRLWQDRVKEGVLPEDLLRAALQYAREMEGKEPDFIKHPSTFLSAKDRPFEDYIEREREFKEREEKRRLEMERRETEQKTHQEKELKSNPEVAARFREMAQGIGREAREAT
jgi:hypothetical protein